MCLSILVEYEYTVVCGVYLEYNSGPSLVTVMEHGGERSQLVVQQ